ncbi:MAG: Mbov_0396 family ICE element transmembrane protein [Catonella sp.]|uniref:Mbov_0396 family ICE element transmembrane protein n=1 Tax=Catonella sp. TaxID=2382125 RepID=UPI003F9F5151
MEYAYLGLFSVIFNWIFDKILSPVLKFLSGLLETVLGWIFNEVLGPLLQTILWPIIKGTIDLIFEALSGIFYSVFADMMTLINSLQNAFDYFSGVKEVTVVGGNSHKTTLLMAIFEQSAVQKVFLILMAFSIFLCLLLSVIAVARASMDIDGENHRNVSRVMKSLAKAMFQFLLVQFSCLLILTLGGAVLKSVKTASEYSIVAENAGKMQGEVRISNILFVISSLDAAKPGSEDKNLSDIRGKNENLDILKGKRGEFYFGKLDPTDKTVVEKYFKLGKMDYFIGYGMGIFFVVILIIVLCKFMTRIFEVVLLYIISPFFVATMPLDDGEKFRGWQDLFVGKIFSGYGTVIAMQIYLLICPYVMSGNIIFGKTTVEGDYIIKLIFVAGGAFGLLKAGSTLTALLSQNAGMKEEQTGVMVHSLAMSAGSYLTGKVENAGSQAFGYVSSLKNGQKDGDKTKEMSQKFDGKRGRS